MHTKKLTAIFLLTFLMALSSKAMEKIALPIVIEDLGTDDTFFYKYFGSPKNYNPEKTLMVVGLGKEIIVAFTG